MSEVGSVRHGLVEAFHTDPAGFSHQDVIDSLLT